MVGLIPTSTVTPDEHDTLVTAYAHLRTGGQLPTAPALAALTGISRALCDAWLRGGRYWPSPANPD